MENLITFPGLGLEFNIPKVAFSIGSRDIAWYGILIAIGFILSTIYAVKRRDIFDLTEDNIIDSIMIGGFVGIICARLYYVAFEWHYYSQNLSKIFSIWEGGIAIYGGIIGGILGFWMYSKIKKVSFLSLLDSGACCVLIGQAIGRYGNFVNQEAYGSETTSIFRMVFNTPLENAGAIGFHPTFFYESCWSFIGVILLYFISKNMYKFKGQIALSYLAWYGFGRGFIEGLRTDSLYFGTIRVSQALGFISSFISILLLVYLYKKNCKENKNDIA